MASKGKTLAAVPDAEQIQRERDVLEMRRAGASFEEIAERVGYASRGSAYRAFKRALARTLQAPAAEIRELEADRLDRLQMALWPKAMRGETRAVDRVLAIMERRARLLGLDHSDGLAERQQRLQELQGMLVAKAVQAILDDLHLTPEQRDLVPTVVPRRLRAITEGDDAHQDEVAGGDR